jgi:hypothetical protein
MALPGIDQDHLPGAQRLKRAVYTEKRGGAAAMKDDLMVTVDVSHGPAGHPSEKDGACGPLQNDRIARQKKP